MLGWLQNQSLYPDVRAQAYCLLPDKPTEDDSLEADVTLSICQGFIEAVDDFPLLLTTTGQLVHSKKCISPPKQAYAVWTPAQLLEVFGNGEEHSLFGDIAEKHRRRLESWGWIDNINVNRLIEQLAGRQRIPRPAENGNIFALWSFVQQSILTDYGGNQRRQLAIIPVEGADFLLSAGNVVRLPSKKEFISDDAWEFLTSLVHLVDTDWLRYLETIEDSKEKDKKKSQDALQLLRDLGFNRPSETNAIMRNACRNLFSRQDVSLDYHVRIAHLMAALDSKTPEEFRCITKDGQQRKLDAGIIATQNLLVKELIPEDWAAVHLLHDAYFRGYNACTRRHWEEWLCSQKSGFLPFVRLNKTIIFNSYDLKRKVKEFIGTRGDHNSVYFYAQVQQVEVSDFGFPDELKKFWTARIVEDAAVWAKVTEWILASPSWYWKDCFRAGLRESNYSHTRTLCSPITAEWIYFLSSTRCLYDTHSHVRIPAELYLRTPETEPLISAEPFIRAELDNETTKPLLRLLGVRDTLTGLGNLLERLRALSRAPDSAPILSEIVKWYGALDRALARSDARILEEAREAFASEPLILTAEDKWAKSSEVFLYAGEDFLDAPAVHSAANNLGMWERLGVANHPTAALVLDWLKGLPSDQPLDAVSVPRVRAALQHYPTQIWESCSHWLTLDNTWTPIRHLRFRLTIHSPTPWADLFPAIKAKTANLQMLPVELCSQKPFASLAELAACIEYRLNRSPSAQGDSTVKPLWLTIMASTLMRIKLPDEAQTQKIHKAAERLEVSIWQTFDHHDSIQVTPYVDGTPAGSSHSRNVLWYEKSIFVRNSNIARLFDAIAAELARPFADKTITEAFKACLDRNEKFIVDYMKERFVLEDEANAFQPIDSQNTVVAAIEPEKEMKANSTEKKEEESIVVQEIKLKGSLEKTDEKSTPVDAISPHKLQKQETPLFETFAQAQGYHWNDEKKRFIHQDGSWIEHREPPFHWQRLDAAGNIVTNYWASSQCLTKGGVEVAAELWGLFQNNSKNCSMILMDEEGDPTDLPGPDLLQQVEAQVIVLYPAKYRIRKNS